MITRISLGLAIAAALPLAAQAHEAAAPASLPVADAAAAAVAAADVNQIVIVRDAETGQLRPATTEEHNAITALKALPANVNARARVASRAAALTPVLKQHRSGAIGVRLTEDMVSQSVMVRGADGKLIEACFASKEEAEAFMKNGGALAKSALPTE